MKILINLKRSTKYSSGYVGGDTPPPPDRSYRYNLALDSPAGFDWVGLRKVQCGQQRPVGFKKCLIIFHFSKDHRPFIGCSASISGSSIRAQGCKSVFCSQ